MIKTDDLLAPRPNPTLRLQEQYIKGKLESIECHKNETMQKKLIDLMLRTNERTNREWTDKLEDFKIRRTVIAQDLTRFEQEIISYRSLTQPSEMELSISKIQVLLLDYAKIYFEDWQKMLATKDIDQLDPPQLAKWK